MARSYVALALPLLVMIGCSESTRSDTDATTFAALGHIRELPDDVLGLLAARINEENPDYIFVLGDMTFSGTKTQTERIQRTFLDRLTAPYYVAPGNHDLISGVEPYRDWIGYRYEMIRDRNANFLLIDSNDDSRTLRSETQALLGRADPAKPTILMTHHHVWKRHLRVIDGEFVRRHHQRAFWKTLGDRFAVGFAGDAVKNFSATALEGRRYYSVGVYFGGHCRPVYFARGETDANGRMLVRPVYLDLPTEHPWHTRRLPKFQWKIPGSMPTDAPVGDSASGTGENGALGNGRCEGRGATIHEKPLGMLKHPSP